jgi:hypothetical protein
MVVPEVAGAMDIFRPAWECARPNAIVTAGKRILKISGHAEKSAV